MIRTLGIVVILFGISGIKASAQDFKLDEINNRVKVFMATTGISGVALSFVQEDKHQELYFGSTGRADSSHVNEKTLFEIGSLTKVFTPHLMLIAQQEGKLSIQDPVSKWVPALRGNPVFEQIMLKDLANHTSSLPAYYDTPKNLKTRAELMQWLLNWKPPFPPRTQYLYSNIGIALIGFALEEAYHQKWDKILNSKILASRKMTSTFLNVPTQNKKQIAQGFDDHRKPAELLPESWILYPAGALKSNAKDLGAYLATWDENFLQTLKDPVCFSNHSCQGLGIEAHPLTNLSQSFMNLQFTTDKISDPKVNPNEHLPPLNQIFIDKTGSTDGMSAYVIMDPTLRVGVVVLCNGLTKERVNLGREILEVLRKSFRASSL